MSTLGTLQNILVEEFKRNPEQLRPEATLADLGIDSLDLVDLIFKIEDHFGLKIKDDVPRSLVTLADVVAYIDEQRSGKAAESVSAAGMDRPS
jgi:acyl carrier protein